GLMATGVERVEAAMDAVDKDADIVIEMHRKLTPLQAGPVSEALAPFHPLLIEDPIQIDSIQSQAELSDRISSAVANGERMHTIWEFRELLARSGSQYVRPD